jgi:hypothetical protein
MIGGLLPALRVFTVMVPITSSYIEPEKIAFISTLKQKQASSHPTMLKRQDLMRLLKSHLRGKTQDCANWRSLRCWRIVTDWRSGGRRKWRMLEIP